MKMKISKHIRNLQAAAMILLLAVGFTTSCTDDSQESKNVVLQSFGPSGVKHGDKIKFIGLNLDKVTSIVLPGIEVPSSQFTSKSSRTIELVVPELAEAGKVTLKTPGGDIQTKTMLNFLVPVAITSITAEARPGSNISIKGSLVNWIEEITFSDGLVVTDFVSKSLDELVVAVPEEAQSGFLIFKTGGTKPLTFASEEQLIVTMPVVTSLTPLAIRHSDVLTIHGTDLDLVSEIIFPEGISVTEFESATATELTVKVPNTAKKGKLTLKVPSGLQLQTSEEISIILPKGTALTPSPAGPGVELTIVGTDLDLVKSIIFPDVATPVTVFVSQTATQIVVKAPDDAMSTGALFFVTIHDFQSGAGVQYKVPSNSNEPLLTIYSDALNSNWSKWDGWGTSAQDLLNTEFPKNGTNAIKIAYSADNGYGGFQLHPNSPDPFLTDSYAFLRLSIAGGSGTSDGTPLTIYIKTKEGTGEDHKVTLNMGSPNTFKTFDIPLSQFGSPANINEFVVQNWGTAGATFYLDDIGFFASEDPLLAIYTDGLNANWGKWDGWGTATQDLANGELPKNGTSAIKIAYAADNGYGGFQLHPNSPSPFLMDSYTSLKISIAGGDGTAADTPITIYIKTAEGTGEDHKVTLNLGAPNTYKTFTIPLSEFGNPANINEFVIQNWGTAGATFYLDDIGLY
jgi:hypothetical protein